MLEFHGLQSALGIAVDVTLRATVILALAGVTTLALRSVSAAMRHLVWAAAVTGLLVLPALVAVSPGWGILPRWQKEAAAPNAEVSVIPPAIPAIPAVRDSGSDAGTLRMTGEALSAPVVRAAASAPPGVPWRPHWQSIATALWIIGVVVMVVPIVVAQAALMRLVRRARVCTDSVGLSVVEEVQREWAMTRKVRVLEGPDGSAPMTFGVARPAVLVPAESREWPAAQWRMVLRHELAHVRRWDVASQLLAHTMRAIYWFHPLAWVACAKMAAEREAACDDMVLAGGLGAAEYAEQLLAAAAMYGRSGWMARMACRAAVPMARRSTLEGRVRAVLDGNCSRRRVSAGLMLVAVFLGMAVVVPVAILRAADAPAAGTAATTMPGAGAGAQEAAADRKEAAAELKAAEAKVAAAEAEYARMKAAYPNGAPTALMFEVVTRLDAARAERFAALRKSGANGMGSAAAKPVPGVEGDEGMNAKIKQVSELADALRAEEKALKDAQAATADPAAGKQNLSDAERRDADLKITIQKARVSVLTAQYRKALAELNTMIASVGQAAPPAASGTPFELRLVLDADEKADDVEEIKDPDDAGRVLRVRKRAELDATALASVRPAKSGENEVIELTLTKEGADKFGKISHERLHKKIAIFLDGKLVMAPVIQSFMDDGKLMISVGSKTTAEEVRKIAEELQRAIGVPSTQPKAGAGIPPNAQDQRHAVAQRAAQNTAGTPVFVGSIHDDKGLVAVLQNPQGMIYVRVGDKLDWNGSRVAEITKDTIRLEGGPRGEVVVKLGNDLLNVPKTPTTTPYAGPGSATLEGLSRGVRDPQQAAAAAEAQRPNAAKMTTSVAEAKAQWAAAEKEYLQLQSTLQSRDLASDALLQAAKEFENARSEVFRLQSIERSNVDEAVASGATRPVGVNGSALELVRDAHDTVEELGIRQRVADASRDEHRGILDIEPLRGVTVEFLQLRIDSQARTLDSQNQVDNVRTKIVNLLAALRLLTADDLQPVDRRGEVIAVKALVANAIESLESIHNVKADSGRIGASSQPARSHLPL